MAPVESFRLPSLPEALPFSSAVRTGGTVYVSGQIGHVPGELRLVAGGFETEARQALDYMREALEMAGSSLDRVVKCTVFLTDIGDLERLDAIYREYFPKHLPARSAFQVQGLAQGAAVEIECVAAVG